MTPGRGRPGRVWGLRLVLGNVRLLPPRDQSSCDVSEGALGVALLCVGLGALTSMRPMGALVAVSALIGRLLGQQLARRVSERALIAGGAGVAAAGTLLAATARSPSLALFGIGVAGLGTSVCAPTLITLAGRNATAKIHASAVSIVTTIAYLGFLIGPAAVGLGASATSLPIALAGVALLAAMLALGALWAPALKEDEPMVLESPQAPLLPTRKLPERS